MSQIKMLQLYVVISMVLSGALFWNLSKALERTVLAIETYRNEELKMIGQNTKSIIFIQDVVIKALEKDE